MVTTTKLPPQKEVDKWRQPLMDWVKGQLNAKSKVLTHPVNSFKSQQVTLLKFSLVMFSDTEKKFDWNWKKSCCCWQFSFCRTKQPPAKKKNSKTKQFKFTKKKKKKKKLSLGNRFETFLCQESGVCRFLMMLDKEDKLQPCTKYSPLLAWYKTSPKKQKHPDFRHAWIQTKMFHFLTHSWLCDVRLPMVPEEVLSWGQCTLHKLWR